MSYLALYRKYRPQTFDDVVGQEHIVRTLKNQINSHRVAHAYLFTGSRGTGKTSIAKIFARAVNCETPVNGSACGQCETCKRVQDGSAINIIEMDAASHNGVDNIREINEEVKYTPAVGKYKVYIIDEVHMLSIGAFNALLKTLEEPPAHVIFILATTDPQKIPVTILSRCQRFDFKRIAAKEIEASLRSYMDKENIDIEEKALAYIARIADGGMRDALSILEQSISFYFGEIITMEKVLYLVGAVDSEILFKMIYAIMAQDATFVLALCDEVNRQGRSIRQFASDLLEHSRNLLVAKTTNNSNEVLDYSNEYIEALKKQAKDISTNEIMRYIKQFGILEYELRTAISPRILLEVAVLKLCEVEMDDSVESMMTKVQMLEQKLDKLMSQGIAIQQSASVVQQVPQKEVIPTRLPKAVPEDIKEIVSRWPEVLNSLDNQTTLKTVYATAEAGYIEDDVLYIVYKHSMEYGVRKNFEKMEKAICNFVGKEVTVRLMEAEEYASRCIETYGSSPTSTPEVQGISQVLRNIESKINFNIEVR